MVTVMTLPEINVSFMKIQRKKMNHLKKLAEIANLIYQPKSYLREVQNDLFRVTGVSVSPSTIFRSIK